jgi:REP element-mobilizing transposase RayT
MNRKSIRLPEYDYSRLGAYFVTVSTQNKQPIFGRINGYEVELSRFGKIATTYWQEIPSHFPSVELDAFIVMPNHIHGILWIIDSKSRPFTVGARHASPPDIRATQASPLQISKRPRGPHRSSLGAIIGSYKSAVSRTIRILNNKPIKVWQRNYYEHVVREDRELDAIRNYVINNAIKYLPLPIVLERK